ncbi:PD-(D/E)XK motif protein [Microbacterium sp. RU33B]|uniref:PD-(D/E)XK motif protein n=1 Tax=Microbacterium sp. RU33B TaxID=1907390 RepID=UPI0009597387|nr:PD-(D/E)XK motif protein [Microbacterium sp. RU33B]SIT70224.1 Putative PD-(D/E)XK family member [Microbacterium sp. RU33B]
MSTGYARVEHALKILGARRPRIGEAVAASIGPDRNMHEARLAKDHLGIVHLIVSLPAGRSRFAPPLGDVLPAKWLDEDFEDGVKTSLDVASTDPSLTPTFLSLVGEMLSRVDETDDPCIDELMRVLSSWREALSREGRTLSRQRLIGLFGELTVLARLAEEDPVQAKSAWRGQAGYRHDFFLSNALEVKAYTGTDSPSVEIHGAHQLDPPIGASLHLLTLRLEESPAGETIAELIERIDALGLPKGLLFERSTDESPIASDDAVAFVVAEERLFQVSSDFPGVRASVLGAEALTAVSRLRYSLLLDACPGRIDADLLPAVLENL